MHRCTSGPTCSGTSQPCTGSGLHGPKPSSMMATQPVNWFHAGFTEIDGVCLMCCLSRSRFVPFQDKRAQTYKVKHTRLQAAALHVGRNSHSCYLYMGLPATSITCLMRANISARVTGAVSSFIPPIFYFLTRKLVFP